MARVVHFSFCCSFALFAICVATSVSANEDRKDYIVYMGALPSDAKYSPKQHHMSMLQKVVNSSYAAQALIRSYTRSFNGFAAHLTEAEAHKLSSFEEVVSIFASKNLQLFTTKSWDFMGFAQTAHRNLKVEGDIIIGVIDTGIWPESESFNDHGFGPIPSKWKGACQGGQNFTCNKKIIGARTYLPGTSCRDSDGHGSHTASTAAGNNVENASFFQVAKGTARGAVPSARIATYKVCSTETCSETGIMAAFDDAIADRVDILSVSLGTTRPIDLKDDAIAIGAFHAAENGILTVQAAGNSGTIPGSVTSTAPWLFTVAASTTDRKIVSKVVIGDGKTLVGYSVNSFELNGTQFPVVYGAGVGEGHCDEESAKSCIDPCLDEKLIKGKIVLCNAIANKENQVFSSALGVVSRADVDNVSFVFPFSTSVLNDQQFKLAERYYYSTKNPTMNILKSEGIKDLDAPVVAAFSSRGPNFIIPDILKPDITAPGVDILAAFSPESPPSSSSVDKRSAPYNIISGTSMSCPHVTGAAAYVKSFHPDWSASAIKSALMTTASRMTTAKAKYGHDEFSYGAGHIDPVKATNPGIVYDTSKEDYIKLLCGLNITSSMVAKMSGYNITCTDTDRIIKPKDLNYPSMAAQLGTNDVNGGFKVEFPRRVTNVGLPNSAYKAKIVNSSPCKISVVPSILSFKKLNETKSFVVTVTGKRVGKMISASLEWSDGIHIARSPIVVQGPEREYIIM